MTKDNAGHGNLQWHCAFVQAIQAELFDYREYLEFRQEFPLTAAPLQIDLLIIKKPKELTIDKNIARIFRTDNVVEYKSPRDYLSIKNFWKVYAYANLYAAIIPGVDLAEITLTFIGSRHPRKLLRYLTNVRGCTVEETSPGIYLVKGDYLPIQIIESQKLSENENLWLNSLRGNLKGSSLNVILRQGKRWGQETPLDAYLDLILRANKNMEVDKMWQDTLKEIVTEAGFHSEWIERGRVQGIEQGREEAACKALAKGLTPELVRDITGLDIEKVRELTYAI